MKESFDKPLQIKIEPLQENLRSAPEAARGQEATPTQLPVVEPRLFPPPLDEPSEPGYRRQPPAIHHPFQQIPARGQPAGLEMLFLALALAVVFVPAWLKFSAASSSTEGLRLEGAPAACPRIQVRTAPWDEWTLLEGIGEARSRKIVEYRQKIGGFRTLEDLKGIPGMPRGWLEKASEYLILENRAGETSVK